MKTTIKLIHIEAVLLRIVFSKLTVITVYTNNFITNRLRVLTSMVSSSGFSFTQFSLLLIDAILQTCQMDRLLHCVSETN
jgi:hypothetical protein